MLLTAAFIATSPQAVLAAPATAPAATATVPPDPAVAPAPVATTTVAPPGARAAQGKAVFTPADFARFAPKTALDMLKQLPGFSIRDAETARGLGQASGNVLVNSRRLSSKSDDIATQLARIPASTVERIELVDAATLDIPGLSGQVANIVAASKGLSGQFSWEPEFRAHYAHPMFTRGQVSVSGRKDWLEYTLSIANLANHSAAGGPTQILDSSGAVIETRQDVWAEDYEEPKISGKFTIDGPGSSVANINVSVQRIYDHYGLHGLRTPVAGTPFDYFLDDRNRDGNWELGGDVEFRLGPGRLKLIGLNHESHEPFSETVVVRPVDGSPATGDRFAQTGDLSERIARAEYNWKLLGADWQLAGEGAFNTLRNVAAIASLDATGQFVDVPFPGGTGGVSEKRYDASLSASKPLSPKVTLQLIVGAERSTLMQTGANGLTRSFFRPKGSASLAWKPSSSFDLSVRLRRRVGQLSFYDFLARQFLDNGNANAGNAELVPQQDWTLEIEANKSFGAWGSTKLRFTGRQVEDYVTVIPIGLTGESVGNVPRARVRVIESNTTLQFDPIGWKGAKLDIHGLYQYTRLPDPLTGKPIAYGDITDQLLELNLRQDVPGTKWAWGSSVQYSHQTAAYRLGEIDRRYEGPVFASLFVENKDVFGLTVHAEVGNVINARSKRDRIVYTGRRDTSPIAFIEARNRLIGPIFSFQVKGTF
ncbi:TonB-dependent receptor plug domain-containing protein [Novosphingobium lentum]|uniref:TonB-dependent receptor plug domain-containing protein n=1 Tax=Novosphingobium lentum TaxID=145287 RepID=UPI001FE1A883|nr:TonB-dependent receptor plug domain-containing protein [Novosphingobium lentum]